MARRNDIDWQAIRREWETSAASEREIAAKHGLHNSTLSARATREGWKKDIVDDVRRGVAHTVLSGLGAKMPSAFSGDQSRQIVDAAVKAVSEHVARHIQVCDRALSIGTKLMDEIEVLCDRPDIVTLLAEALVTADESQAAKKLIEAAEKAASLPARAAGFQKVQSGNSAAIATIRTALGLDEKPDQKGGQKTEPAVFNWAAAPAKPAQEDSAPRVH